MGFFIRKKKIPRPVWRNARGKVECPGNGCPQKCDDTCPIWLNTLASRMVRIGENEKALELFEKMIAMAPDFYDPWNNMGVYYEAHGKAAEAKKCYEKAHEIKPERPSPIYGLAIANRDLGEYQESLKWCNLYGQMLGDHRLDEVRRTCDIMIAQQNNL